jgi:hypothetical protein
MGIRLVKYGMGSDIGTYDHNELDNRSLPNQHPISSISGLQEELNKLNTNLNNKRDYNIEDTPSVDLELKNGNTFTANVKIFDSEENAIQQKITGLFVDAYPNIETESTKTAELYQEGKGETLLQMYNGGNVFSHNGGTSNIANTNEANAWYFDTSLNSFVQPLNTGTFTGFVSRIKYKTYNHKATLRSTASDNDANGLVIAYVTDEYGNPHTLSCIVNKGGESHAGPWYYALVYNRSLNGEQVIKTGIMSNGHNKNGWNGNFITMEVSKAGNAIECSISDWGSLIINTATVMTIDLNDYPWGYLFSERVQYGYCNQSQANSYFTDISFSGKGPLKADIIISPDVGNVIEKRENGLYVKTELPINTITQKNHGFAVGDFIYYHHTNKYQKALGIDDFHINIIGMVTKVINANSFTYMTDGFFATSVFKNNTLGKPLYISDKNPGKVTQTQPNVSKCVGYPVENGIVIHIERGIQYYDEAAIGDFKKSATNYKIRSDGYILVKDGADYNLSLIQKLIDNTSESFVVNYLTIDDDKAIFKNTADLYYKNNLTDSSVNLYIKAF